MCRSSLAVLMSLSILLLFAGCGGDREIEYGPIADPEVAAAYARLHGAVRWFHPADEAAAISWNRHAILAVRALAGVDPGDLQAVRTALADLFVPVAPTLQITASGDHPPPASGLLLDDTDGLRRVAWQHLGLGNDGTYRSQRINRPDGRAIEDLRFGGVAQFVPAAPYRGGRIRLQARMRAEGRAQAWLRVDRAEDARGFFDNMDDRAVTDDTWRQVVIEGPVARDAERIALGAFLVEQGRAWIDDLVVQWRPESGGQAAWQEVPVVNGGFDTATDTGTPAGWWAASEGYEYAVEAGALSIRSAGAGEFVRRPLFWPVAGVGDVATVELGLGLVAHVPLAVWGSDVATLPPAEDAALAQLEAALDHLPAVPDLADPAVRVAEVVVAWSALRHFFPYQDVVDIAWDDVLADGIARAAAAPGAGGPHAAQRETLDLLLAVLEDGHCRVGYRGHPGGTGAAPIQLLWLEDDLVVVASAVPEIAVGDRLVAVDGVDALALADRFAARVSGSPQWKRWGAPQRMLRARPGTRVTLTVAGPDGRLREVVTTRVRRPEMPAPSRPAPVARLEPGVWYVDLDRAPMVRIRKHLDDLVTAAGVVFDLRGYPANNHEILQHLMTAPERGGDWMQVPRIWRPEFAQVGWRPLSWNLTPAAPRITGRVVFLTDGRAISYAESVMGYVREYALGTIVGGPTAGSNGNVKTLVLPGGSQVSWTGMRVVTHDGEVQHAVGVQPDVRCAPTLAGIRAGRDEVLERGVAIAAGREGGREGGRESPVRQIVDGP